MNKVYKRSLIALVVMFALFFIAQTQINKPVTFATVKGEHTTQKETSKAPETTPTTPSDDGNVAEANQGGVPADSRYTGPVSKGRGSGSVLFMLTNNTASAVVADTPSAPVSGGVGGGSENPIVVPVVVNAAPVVNITAPAANAVISGAVKVNATASDDKGIVLAELLIDNAPAGTTTAAAPYSFDWDTTKMADGNHTVTVRVSDVEGLSASSIVTVTIKNTVTIPVPPVTAGNLIANPSVEDSVGADPTGWAFNQYPANDASGAYDTTDVHSGTHSVKITMPATAPAGAGAQWVFAPVNVTAGLTYKYSNWYKSDVATEIDAMVTMADGSLAPYYVSTVAPSATWAQASAFFQIPAGATAVSFYQILSTPGTLQADDFSLTQYQPASFSRAVISLTFDDAWRSIYDNALPVLKAHSMVSTQYLLTGSLTYDDYMTVTMMQAFKDAGSEIAGHTVDHCALAGPQPEADPLCSSPLSAAELKYQIEQNKADLEKLLGVTVTDFASPYGTYTPEVLAALQAAGYTSHRSVETGFNSADNLNPMDIKVQNMTNTTTLAEVQAWVDSAIANKTWLVIVYHEVTSTTPAEDATYSVTKADLDAQLAYIQSKNVAVLTVADALKELTPQVVPAQ